MRNAVIKMLKYTSFIMGMFFLFSFCGILYLKYQLKLENQIISNSVRHIDPPPVAIAFRYSQKVDRQLELFSKNMGFWENSIGFKKPKIGANGFVSINLNLQKSDHFFSKLDEILSVFLDENMSISSDENVPEIASVSSPISDLIEEAWNKKILNVGSVVQLQPSFVDYAKLLLNSGEARIFNKKAGGLSQLVVENLPSYFQVFLDKHFIKVTAFDSVYNKEKSLYHTRLNFSIFDSEGFLNSICVEKMDPLDFCGRFLFDRIKLRKNIASTLFFFHNNFNVTLDFYWKVQGGSFIFSNTEEFITKIFEQDKLKHSLSENILTHVSSSGDDFLFPENENPNQARLSFLLDMIQVQNKTIDFFERMKTQSRIVNDLISSPTGEDSFERIQGKINQLTSYSEKASVTLMTDGEKLFSEMRLYEPSYDLFIHDGAEIAPEVLNSFRMFIVRIISFGNYQLLRGLFPIPKPIVTRNGKWAIIRSNLLLKSIEPYFKRLGPQIDPAYEVKKL